MRTLEELAQHAHSLAHTWRHAHNTGRTDFIRLHVLTAISKKEVVVWNLRMFHSSAVARPFGISADGSVSTSGADSMAEERLIAVIGWKEKGAQFRNLVWAYVDELQTLAKLSSEDVRSLIHIGITNAYSLPVNPLMQPHAELTKAVAPWLAASNAEDAAILLTIQRLDFRCVLASEHAAQCYGFQQQLREASVAIPTTTADVLQAYATFILKMTAQEFGEMLFECLRHLVNRGHYYFAEPWLNAKALASRRGEIRFALAKKREEILGQLLDNSRRLSELAAAFLPYVWQAGDESVVRTTVTEQLRRGKWLSAVQLLATLNELSYVLPEGFVPGPHSYEYKVLNSLAGAAFKAAYDAGDYPMANVIAEFFGLADTEEVELARLFAGDDPTKTTSVGLTTAEMKAQLGHHRGGEVRSVLAAYVPALAALGLEVPATIS